MNPNLEKKNMARAPKLWKMSLKYIF